MSAVASEGRLEKIAVPSSQFHAVWMRMAVFRCGLVPDIASSPDVTGVLLRLGVRFHARRFRPHGQLQVGTLRGRE